MTDKKEIPGITFHLDELQEQGTFDGKLNVKFVLTAIADTSQLVEVVRKKFEGGFRVHTVEDFKGLMLNTLKEDYKALERKIMDLETRLRLEEVRRQTAERAHVELRESLSFKK